MTAVATDPAIQQWTRGSDKSRGCRGENSGGSVPYFKQDYLFRLQVVPMITTTRCVGVGATAELLCSVQHYSSTGIGASSPMGQVHVGSFHRIWKKRRHSGSTSPPQDLVGWLVGWLDFINEILASPSTRLLFYCHEAQYKRVATHPQ